MTIVIDAATKKILLEQLESLNIHGGSVYPDLASMSKYIRHKYQKEKQTVPINVLSDFDLYLHLKEKDKKQTRTEKRELAASKEPSPEVHLSTINRDYIDFEDEKIISELTSFVNENNLKLMPTKKIIQDYLDFKTPPLGMI